MVAAATMVVFFAGCGEPVSREAQVKKSGEGSEAASHGDWQRIREAPVGWYKPEGAFWIGGRLVVVAGSSIQAWEPERGWDVLVTIPQAEQCEGCGYAETAVWTGDEILLWGGGFSYKSHDVESAGAAFELQSGTLRALPPAPVRSRWWHSAVWTGNEMIVWGGACGRHECRDGAAYNPQTDSWRRIADAPVPGYAHTTIWTGEEMIVWGGSDDYESEGTHGFPRSFINEGAAYDPATDTWRMLEPSPVEPRGWHTAVWTGEEMIVWGGVRSPCTTAPCDTVAAMAGTYDPDTGIWREIPDGPLPGRVDHTAVWTGQNMIVWGGSPPGGGLGYNDGAVYDPAHDRWSELPDAPISDRYRHAALWNGDAMVIWGGQGGSGEGLSDGAVFYPEQ
jgi:hypothetical protein